MKKLSLKSILEDERGGPEYAQKMRAVGKKESPPISETGKSMYVVQIKQLPTFFLDPNVLGITSPDHAKRIVQKMIKDMKNIDINDIQNPVKVDM